ncbi:geranylgeranyl pyrophosphate synthase [Actinomycetes bacterium]|nr:geranylgeranyl pyrophosphate synthase [Actinomycetes bacterium]
MLRPSLDRFSTDPVLESKLAQGLARVEAALDQAVRSEYPFVTAASRHLVDAGGKRFRPLLVLLSAHFGDPGRPAVISAAVAVELTHVATLYHDDVMDEAAVRRGADTANARWGNSVAILTGDFLFARSSAILADLGPDAVRIQAQTFERLCTGQILESVGPADGMDPVKHHLAVLADKTGSLIATSCRYGAMMSGASSDVTETLTRFGELIGVAFQLADDIVDITSDSVQSGKTPGIDLREGVPTLATLMALGSQDPADGRLRELLGRPLPDDAEHAEALALLRGHVALDEARAEAGRWADEARSVLDPLPEGAPKSALATLCDYVVTRTG